MSHGWNRDCISTTSRIQDAVDDAIDQTFLKGDESPAMILALAQTGSLQCLSGQLSAHLQHLD
ncbi:MAG: hypothetical protein ACK50P_14875, partial [Planctomycetaceae bacterium]